MITSLEELRDWRGSSTNISERLQDVIEAAIINRKKGFSQLGLLGGAEYQVSDFDPQSNVGQILQEIQNRRSGKLIYYDSDHCWYAQLFWN